MNNISPTRDEILQAANNARRAGRLEEEKELLQWAAEVSGLQQEIVAGTPDQMAAARARNLQVENGLSEPVALPSEGGGLTLGQRSFASRAPTQRDLENYFRLEFGDGNYINLGSDKYLVKRNGKWYLNDPVGLEPGDIADLVGYGPQFVAGAATGVALAPGPIGTAAKLAKASGIPAAASAIAGGLQDIYFRFATDQPINPGEIVARRGGEAAADFAFGMAIPAVGGKVANLVAQRGAVKAFYRNIEQEGAQAIKNLQDAGINPATSADLGQAIRELSPAKKSAYEMGDAIAQMVNEQDEILSAQASKQASRAGLDASARAKNLIDSIVAPNKYSIDEVGSATIAAAQSEFKKTNAILTQKFDDAMKEIAAAGMAKGTGSDFVRLSQTKKTLDEVKRLSLKSAKEVDEGGVQIDRVALASDIEGLMTRLGKAVDTPQELMAVRAERTRIGEFLRGNRDLFPGMSDGTAKRIYASLTKDIEDSVKTLSGPGADKLKEYNNLYRSMMEPIESNSFVSKLVNGGFENPEEVVDAFSRAGTNDWNLTRGIVPPRTFDFLRRAVLDKMKGDATVDFFGTKLVDVPQLVSRMNNMGSDTVRNELFGGPKAVEALRTIGNEYKFLTEKAGLFTRASLPSMDEINTVISEARTNGVEKANVYFNQAINTVKNRRNALGSSLIGLARDGNFNIIAKDPNAVFDAVVFNPGINGVDVKKFVASMPPTLKREMADTAWQSIFDNARSAVNSSVRGTRESFDVDAVIKKVFNDKGRVDAMTDLIGDKRMDVLRNWIAWDTKLAIDSKRTGFETKRLANLIATAPYPNLFAARATSMGLESVAGLEFIKGANPVNVVAFPRARQAYLRPTKTAADIALIQQAINIGGKEMFDKYNEMMNQLTPEQEAAAAQYLFGGRD